MTTPTFPPDPAAELAKEIRLTAAWLEERAAVLGRIRVPKSIAASIGVELARLRGRATYLRVRADTFAGPAVEHEPERT